MPPLSLAMAARLALALLTALAGAGWFWRAGRVVSPSSVPPVAFSAAADTRLSPSLTRWRGLTLGLAAFWSLAWLLIALARARYPYELDWNCGALRDPCARLLAGQPLYVAPSPDWIPFFYTPLYCWVCALVMRLTGGVSFLAMRGVSTAATLGCAALLTVWVRRLVNVSTSPRPSDTQTARAPIFDAGLRWGLTAGGLFLAAYRFTGARYDLEWLDPQFLFFCLLGVVWLERALARPRNSRGQIAWAALSGLAFFLSFLTKQQAAVFIAGGLGVFGLNRAWRGGAAFAFAAVGLSLGAVVWLNWDSGGWFGYYAFRVPLGQGVTRGLAAQYLLQDLPLYAPALAIIGLTAWPKRSRGEIGSEKRASDAPENAATAHEEKAERAAQAFQPPQNAVLGVMTACGLATSLFSRAHWGGDQNVLMPGYLFSGAAACALAGRRERTRPQSGLSLPALYFLVAAQFVVLTYRPDAQLPTSANWAAGARFAAVIRDLERAGPTLCLDHGGFTSTPHFHSMALMNLLLAERRLPPGFLDAQRRHPYAAIVTDARPAPGAFDGLTDGYTPVRCLNFQTSWVVTGYQTPNPARPVWILRPLPNYGRIMPTPTSPSLHVPAGGCPRQQSAAFAGG